MSFSDARIVITINGPGEVSSWLHPLGLQLKQALPGVRICVALMPCVFATGAEHAVVASEPFVDDVCLPSQTTALGYAGRLPPGFGGERAGVLLHLGGDPVLSWLVAKRLRHPALAYVEEPFFWSVLFDKVLYSGLWPMPEGASPERHLEVGEMIVDAVWLRHPTRRRLDPPKVVLFPGSRDYIAKFILPFFAKVADVVASQRGDVTFSVARSRFLSRDFLLTIPDVNDGRPIEGDNMTVDCDGDRMTLRTSGGTRLEVEEPRAAIDGASYAVTLPGTATAELAALGIPMAVVLPTYWGETAPLPGLAGHLAKVPALGRYLKRIAGHIHLRRHPVLAHPNLRAGRTIVPELVGRICAADVARPVLDSLAGDREKTSADLIAAMGPDGGAQRVAAVLADYLRRPDVVPAGSPRPGTD